MNQDAAAKEFDPTPRKLDEARRKGEVPIGRDLLAAAAWGGFLLALLIAPRTITGLGSIGQAMLDRPDQLAPGRPLLHDLARALGAAIWPLFTLPAAAVIVALLAQRGFVVAPERIIPKLSRISPLAGLKRRFGRSGLFEFAKSAVKLIMVGGVLAGFLLAHAESIAGTAALSAGGVAHLLGDLVMQFLLVIIALQTVIGGFDLLWQRHDHRRQQRMTRQEMMDEMKNSEGDPQIRAQRRQRAQSIAMSQMLADIPTADVVIVNPTHYAVALKWHRHQQGAPICVAKGVDEVAMRIRTIAITAGVPLRHDPPTARALHASVAIGSEVAPEHYRTVAAAIRFADAIRRQGQAGSSP